MRTRERAEQPANTDVFPVEVSTGNASVFARYTRKGLYSTSESPQDVRPLDVRPEEVKPMDKGPLKARPMDVRPLDVRPLNERLLDVRSQYVRPLKAWSLDVRPLDVKTPIHKSTERETPG